MVDNPRASRSPRILFATYGGGHVQSLIPVIQLLKAERKATIDVLGFTTALAAFKRAGISANGYRYLLTDDDGPWLELARKHKQPDNHLDIEEADSLAYHALGLRDLVGKLGHDLAIKEYHRCGRKAFLPVETFRRYLRSSCPDLVVTSTSPRSELALQYAANDLGIKGLAISDLFLQNESDYLRHSRYAKRITVIARYVEEFLVSCGVERSRVVVTGNPAFDSLNDPFHSISASELRRNFEGKNEPRILLWVCPSATVSMIGKPFIEPDRMLDFLEAYCSSTGDIYLVKEHPNFPVVGNRSLEHGEICSQNIPIETYLNLSDLVLQETSTVGIQAALLGKPVITINNGDYPPYARLRLAVDVASLDQAGEALSRALLPDLTLLGYSKLGHATQAVTTLIEQLTCEGN